VRRAHLPHDDHKLKYGLAATGRVHPEWMITNSGAQADDLLVLSKPLGARVITIEAASMFLVICQHR